MKPEFSGNPPPPSGSESPHALLRQLATLRAWTKYQLNVYPYVVRMAAPSIKEFADEFCSSPIGCGVKTAESFIMGIPIVESSLVPDHEAWVFYHDDTAELGFRVEIIRWGKPKSPLSGAVD